MVIFVALVILCLFWIFVNNLSDIRKFRGRKHR